MPTRANRPGARKVPRPDALGMSWTGQLRRPQADGQNPLDQGSARTSQTKVSRTDPDAGYIRATGKPKGFFYLDHPVDGRLGIITDTFATPAMSMTHCVSVPAGPEVSGDGGPCGLDAGYATSGTWIAKGLAKSLAFWVSPSTMPNIPRPGMGSSPPCLAPPAAVPAALTYADGSQRLQTRSRPGAFWLHSNRPRMPCWLSGHRVTAGARLQARDRGRFGGCGYARFRQV